MFLAMAQDDTLVGGEVREFYAQPFAKGYRPELHLYMKSRLWNERHPKYERPVHRPVFRLDAGAGTHA
jgi:hypothetical protein